MPSRRKLLMFRPPLPRSPRRSRFHGVGRFLRYLDGAACREIAQKAHRQRLPGRSAEIAYGTLLVLGAGIVAVLTAMGWGENLRWSETGPQGPSQILVLLAHWSATVLPGEMVPGTDEISGLGQTQQRWLFFGSLFLALWAAVGVMGTVRETLDLIHGLPRSRSQLGSQLRWLRAGPWPSRLLTLGLALSTLSLLILAWGLVFASDALLRAGSFPENSPWSGWWLLGWQMVSWPLAVGVVTLALGLLYRFGPRRHRRRRPVLPGAILAAMSWVGLAAVVRLGSPALSSLWQIHPWIYGGVILVVLLLWLHLGWLLLLLGSQVNITVGHRRDLALGPPPGSTPRVPPPAFETFTIHRPARSTPPWYDGDRDV